MLAMILLMSLLAVGASQGGEDANLEARWRREYPSAAAELESATREFVAKGTLKIHHYNDDEVETRNFRTAESRGRRVVVLDEQTRTTKSGKKESAGSRVYCWTPDRAFTLRKPVDHSDYAIEELSSTHTLQDMTWLNWHFDLCIPVATHYNGVSLCDRINDHSFVFKSIDLAKMDDMDLVRIGYEYEGEFQLESGRVVLSPAEGWAIRSVELTLKPKKGGNPTEQKIEVKYRRIADKSWFPVSRTSRLGVPKYGTYFGERHEFQDVRLGDVPEEIFKLTAYGLPEIPDRPAPKRSVFTWSNPFLWLTFLAAVVCFTLLWKTRTRADRAA